MRERFERAQLVADPRGGLGGRAGLRHPEHGYLQSWMSKDAIVVQALLTQPSTAESARRLIPETFGNNAQTWGTTKVLTTGLEGLRSAESMLDFYIRDPEHFFLTVGMLPEGIA
jgi:hypothetical protein